MKIVLGNIPSFFKWLIPTVFISPLLILILLNFVQNQELDISSRNLNIVFVMTLATSLLALLWSLFSKVFQLVKSGLNSTDSVRVSTTIDGKIILPYSTIKIGEFKIENLCADILANIYLFKEVQPTVSHFLERIKVPEPFCPTCKKALNLLKTDWVSDYRQVGYHASIVILRLEERKVICMMM